MTVEIDKDMIRLLVLDISGVYSKIHDEIYTTYENELNIRNKYSNTSKFLVVKTMWLEREWIDFLLSFATIYNFLMYFIDFH